MVRQKAEIYQETGESRVLTAEELIIQSLRHFEGTRISGDSLIKICIAAGYSDRISAKRAIDRMVANGILVREGSWHKSWYKLNPHLFTKSVRRTH